MEVHTSDLTADCLKSVQLRLEGKRIGETASAKFRGSLWHEARRLCYERGQWADVDLVSILAHAAWIVTEEAKATNQPLTDAVDAGWMKIAAELQPMLTQYGRVVAPRVVKMIGQECPIRCTIDVDGEPVDFASHIDVLYRNATGQLCIDDDKSQQEVPSREFLARNMQFAMYAYATKHGEIMVDGEWLRFNEWPILTWLHVNNLKPFGRKTTATETDWETGEVKEVEYAKGDTRPAHRVLLNVPIDEGQDQRIMAEFSTRVRMMRAGFWPTNPDEIGCFLCDSKKFCPTFEGSKGAW